MTSNWKAAVTLALVCPHCQAMNRPGAIYIEIQQDGQALCSVCAKQFSPEAA